MSRVNSTLKTMLILALGLFLRNPSIAQIPVDIVPFDIVNHLIFINLQVNENKDTLHFLFDTGAGVTVIDSEVAGKLSLIRTGEARVGTSGKTLLSQESSSNRILIGNDVALDSTTLILMDLSHITQLFKYQVDGVIGLDLLDKYVTETNIDDREMKFYLPDSFSYQGDATASKLTNLESNLFGLIVKVQPRKNSTVTTMNLKIDTGASNWLTLHNRTVEIFDLLSSWKNHKYEQGFGADVTVTNNIKSKTRSLAFGDKKWRNIPTILEVDPLHRQSKTVAHGLLGQRLLLDFNITYDITRGLVYFEKR